MGRSTVQVIVTDEFLVWFDELSTDENEDVVYIVRLLEQMGISLGAPHSSAIKGASFALRELRPRQGRSPLRIFYAFDPRRDAVLLIGGDKSGMSTTQFYTDMIRVADQIWRVYLEELRSDTLE